MTEEVLRTLRHALPKEEELFRWNGRNRAVRDALLLVDVHLDLVTLGFVLAESRLLLREEIRRTLRNAWS